MRQLTIPVALALALAVSASEASPSPKGPAGSKPTVTKVQTQKSGATKPSTVKATPKGTSPSGGKSVKSTQTSPKLASGAETKGSGSKSLKPAKSDTRVAKTDKAVKAQGAQAKAEEKTGKTSTNRSSTTTSGTSTQLVDFTATKVGLKLEKNPALRSKIEAKLQAAGYTGTAYEAAYGFKNVGQLNAATNMVQNQGYSFELIKVLMTGNYVDPDTHQVYRTRQLADGSLQLVKPDLATNPASTLSLGQAKQAITGGSVMPEIVPYTTTGTATTTSTSAKTSK